MNAQTGINMYVDVEIFINSVVYVYISERSYIGKLLFRVSSSNFEYKCISFLNMEGYNNEKITCI